MSEYPYIQKVSPTNDGICCKCKKEGPRIRLEWRVNIFQGDCEFEKVCNDCYAEKHTKPSFKKLPGRIRKVRIYKKEGGGERFIDKNGNTFYLLVIKIGHQECIKYYRTFAEAPKLGGCEGKMAEIEGERYGTQWIIKSMTVEGNPIIL